MFGGEHTEYSLEQKYLSNQPQTTIGNKETAKMQVTDVRMAKLGKDLQKERDPRIRSSLREAAGRLGKAPLMQLKQELKMRRCGDGAHTPATKAPVMSTGCPRCPSLTYAMSIVRLYFFLNSYIF